jgi:hypothetical protein
VTLPLDPAGMVAEMSKRSPPIRDSNVIFQREERETDLRAIHSHAGRRLSGCLRAGGADGGNFKLQLLSKSNGRAEREHMREAKDAHITMIFDVAAPRRSHGSALPLHKNAVKLLRLN